MKNIGTLPDGAILCTVDVVDLYLQIPHDEGLQAVGEALGLSNNLPSDQMENADLTQDIVDFTELVLKNNNFEFNDGLACKNSRPSSLPARVAFRAQTFFTRNATRTGSKEGQLFSQANGRHYVQKLGTAIGLRMAPSYANIFMDKLEQQLISNALIKPHTW